MNTFSKIIIVVSCVLFRGAIAAPLPDDSGVSKQPMTELVGLWEFDDPSDLLHGTIGAALELTGVHMAVDGYDGPGGSDGAVSIDIGSYYTVNHGISPNGGGNAVNEWSLLIDFMYPATSSGAWIAFYQTDANNTNDADCFVRYSDGALGVGDTGYSYTATSYEIWYRMVVTVDNSGFYRIYVNGKLWLDGPGQDLDGRFSLEPTMLLFADENEEDNEIYISTVALYDYPLTVEEVATLNGPGGQELPLSILTHPYLQRVEQDGVTVMWELSKSAPCTVDYGLDDSYGDTIGAVSNGTGAGTEIYSSVLTGLFSGTTYHFRVNVDSIVGDDQIFTTAPDSEVNFSFAQWGDSQGVSSATIPLLQHLGSSCVDLAVSTGDMAENGGTYSSIRNFFLDRVANNVGRIIPFDISWGNHDNYGSAMIKNFTTFGAGNYSFDYSNCHFVCIDWMDDYNFAWIETDLDAADDYARHIFVFIHMPPYCERWIDGDGILRDNLVPLLEQYNVDICFSGHMHGYQRGEQNGVYYVVSGGASWLDTSEPLTVDWPHMTVGGYHDLGAGVDGGLVNEYVIVEVTSTGWTATMTAFHPDGSVWPEIADSFGVTVEPIPTTDPVGLCLLILFFSIVLGVSSFRRKNRNLKM